MLSRFFISVAILLSYYGIWGAVIYFMKRTMPAEQTHTALIIIAIILFASILPLLDWCAKHVFYFASSATAVTEQVLRDDLLAINTEDTPVLFFDNEDTMAATWKYTEPRWKEILELRSVSNMVRVTMRFDEARKRVTMYDTVDSLDKVGTASIAHSFGGSFRGISMDWMMGGSFDPSAADATKAVTFVQYSSSEIHDLLISRILAHGWDVRFTVF